MDSCLYYKYDNNKNIYDLLNTIRTNIIIMNYSINFNIKNALQFVKFVRPVRGTMSQKNEGNNYSASLLRGDDSQRWLT